MMTYEQAKIAAVSIGCSLDYFIKEWNKLVLKTGTGSLIQIPEESTNVDSKKSNLDIDNITTESVESNQEKTVKEKEMLNTEVQYSESTDVIILPKGMSKLAASKELELQGKEEEKIVLKGIKFDDWNSNDAIVAIMRVIKRTFGWINGQNTESRFGSNPPAEIKIKTGLNTFEDCFLGEFLCSPWDNCIGTTGTQNGRAFVTFNVKKRFSARVDAFIEEVNKELRTNSIYKNKSLIWNGRYFDYIENKGTNDIILNSNEQLVLDKFILNPIKNKQGGKRGILFAGVFGTGKTETALSIGRTAVSMGQTFIYCKDRDLAQALSVAKQYAPTVLFIEDLDELTSGDRDEKVNDLLNTIDGIETKGHDITLIMTTNNKENINPAFRRPGRIDIILEFSLPDVNTRANMFKYFLKDVKGSNTLDYTSLAEKMPAIQGAVIRETAHRAALLVEEGNPITNEDVLAAIELSAMQIKFMQEPQKKEDNVFEDSLKVVIGKALNDYYDN